MTPQPIGTGRALAAKVLPGPQPISGWLLRPFIGYIGYYLRRHFQSLQLLNSANAHGLEGWPILVCMNHPSWWDPILALYLSQRFFPEREHYGPIAAEGITQYRFFEKIGFIAIDNKTRAGAAKFLQTGLAVLTRADAALWVTAQGYFTDVRIRPVQLQPGVAHLAHSSSRFVMLPVAFEFSFWLDRKPESFAAVGKPIFIEDGAERTTAEWLQTFSQAVQDTQTLLSEHVTLRTSGLFEQVFRSKPGVGGVYSLWQTLKSFFRSESRTRLS